MSLYRSHEAPPRIIDYCLRHSDTSDPVLEELERITALRTTMPQMLCGPLESAFLAMLVRLHQPKLIVEIGTFTGYSAIAMGRVMQEGAQLITYDINSELVYLQEEYISKAGLTNKIKLRNMSALDDLPSYQRTIDMAFIDGNKREYTEYYKALKSKMRNGGIIIADNTLWSGKVLEAEKDSETDAIHAFNQYVIEDPDVRVVQLPIRDGITMIYMNQ